VGGNSKHQDPRKLKEPANHKGNDDGDLRVEVEEQIDGDHYRKEQERGTEGQGKV